MSKSNSKPKRPYRHFKSSVYVPALWTPDANKIEVAAKLLQLPSKNERGFDFYVQSIAEHHHGEPGVTASAADLKRALDRLSKALTKASEAWTALHNSKINGLRLGVLAAIRETYQDVYVEAFINGSGVRPSEIFKADESALCRLENMIATTVKRIVPDTSGPAPAPRFGLAAEVFKLASWATGRKLKFGTSARAGGRRTGDYRACVLLMQAVDPALADSQCEGPLETAMNDNAGGEKSKLKQPNRLKRKLYSKKASNPR